jgi:hypothetical protein
MSIVTNETVVAGVEEINKAHEDGLISQEERDQAIAMRNAMTEQQEQLVTDATIDDITDLMKKHENGEIDDGYVLGLFDEGKLTEGQVVEITGTDTDDIRNSLGEPSPPSESNLTPGSTERGMGDNSRVQFAYVAEELSEYEGFEAKDGETALKHLHEALDEIIEHEDKSNTSLTAKTAIVIADWLRYTDAGQKIPLGTAMDDSIVKAIGEMVPSEAKTPYFRTIVTNAAKRGVLIMVGKAHVGWFVLPADRKLVSTNDIAVAEYPSSVPEGHKVRRSVCIKLETLKAKGVPVYSNGKLQGWMPIADENKESLVLLTNTPTDALYASLWDLDGELQYDPAAMQGQIVAFKTAATLAKEKAAAEAEVKRKAEADALAKANANQPKENRQTAGTQAEGEATNIKAQLQDAKERIVVLEKQNASLTNPDAKTLLDVALRLEAHIETQPIQVEARTVFYRDARKMIELKTVSEANVKKAPPTEAEMIELVRLFTLLDNLISWDDKKGEWLFGDFASGYAFKNNELKAA